MNKDIILGFVRHVFTAFGGALVTRGTIDSDELGQIIGAIITLIGVGWSIVEKRQRGSSPPPSVGVGLLLLLLVPWLAGCRTPAGGAPDGGSVFTPARVEALCKLTAYTASRAVLVKSPGAYADLARAETALATLCAQEQWDVTVAAAVLESAELSFMQTEEAQIALAGTAILVDLVTNGHTSLSPPEFAAAAIKGWRAGVQLALSGSRGSRGTDPVLTKLRQGEIATRPR